MNSHAISAHASFNPLPQLQVDRTAQLVYWLLLSLVAMSLAACERNGATVDQAQYHAALVGDWQGTVGDEQETISFTQDGHFTAQMLRKGFISNTLGHPRPVIRSNPGSTARAGAIRTRTPVAPARAPAFAVRSLLLLVRSDRPM